MTNALSAYFSSLGPEFLVLRGKRRPALRAIQSVIKTNPPPRLRVRLHALEARTAARLGDGRRTVTALLSGLSAAKWGSYWARDLRELNRLFAQVVRGSLIADFDVPVGPLRLTAKVTRNGTIVVHAYFAGLSETPTVKCVFGEHVVAEPIAEVFSVLPHGGGQFELKFRPEALRDLLELPFTIEFNGTRHPVPLALFEAGRERLSEDPAGLTDRGLSVSERLEAGYILNSDGELALPKNEDSAWLDATFKIYQRVRRWLMSNYGYELYPTGGTLLGYARTGEIIPFDKDFDTGYLSKHTVPTEIRREFRDTILGLLEAGEDVSLLTASSPPAVRRDYVHVREGNTHIDIFVGAFINGKYRRPTFVDTNLGREAFFPFRIANLNGHEVVVPHDVERKVAAVYGPGWRTPDPFWKKVRSPEIVAYREEIQLTREDLLEIAKASKNEGALLEDLIRSGAC